MELIYGPFWPDSNISVGVVAYDAHLWIVRRRAVHDTSGGSKLGVLELSDVRGYRRRTLREGQFLDYPDDADPSFWAIRLTESDYLRACLAENEGRLGASPPHAHYVVPDGDHRVIDVVAKTATCRPAPSPLLFDLSELLLSGPGPHFLT